jgi:hypothetical protein
MASEHDRTLGVWAGTTSAQRAEVARMHEQLGVYEMALRLAVMEWITAEGGCFPPPQLIEVRVGEFVGKAAVMLNKGTELHSPRDSDDAELRDAVQGGKVEGVEGWPHGPLPTGSAEAE